MKRIFQLLWRIFGILRGNINEEVVIRVSDVPPYIKMSVDNFIDKDGDDVLLVIVKRRLVNTVGEDLIKFESFGDDSLGRPF